LIINPLLLLLLCRRDVASLHPAENSVRNIASAHSILHPQSISRLRQNSDQSQLIIYIQFIKHS